MSLIPGFDEGVVEVLDQLNSQLSRHYPTVPGIKAISYKPSSIESLRSYLHRKMPGSDPTIDVQSEFDDKRIFIVCNESDPFVADAQKENPLAHWGIAIPNTFSVAWVNNPYLWWHETLHLFNAKDCYNKYGINKCPEPRCVMQASPTDATCGSRLFLCSKNQRRLSVEPP